MLPLPPLGWLLNMRLPGCDDLCEFDWPRLQNSRNKRLLERELYLGNIVRIRRKVSDRCIRLSVFRISRVEGNCGNTASRERFEEGG